MVQYVCLSVGLSVGRSVGRLVGRSFFLDLFSHFVERGVYKLEAHAGSTKDLPCAISADLTAVRITEYCIAEMKSELGCGIHRRSHPSLRASQE